VPYIVSKKQKGFPLITHSLESLLQRVSSGGILLGCNSAIFSWQIIHNLSFAVTVKFTPTHNNDSWTLTTEREDFANWLNKLQIQDDENWMIIGHFNTYSL
jgi:hypothetical protein